MLHFGESLSLLFKHTVKSNFRSSLVSFGAVGSGEVASETSVEPPRKVRANLGKASPAERWALGSAGFQPAVSGILPGTTARHRLQAAAPVAAIPPLNATTSFHRHSLRTLCLENPPSAILSNFLRCAARQRVPTNSTNSAVKLNHRPSVLHESGVGAQRRFLYAPQRWTRTQSVQFRAFSVFRGQPIRGSLFTSPPSPSPSENAAPAPRAPQSTPPPP
jgi:hypothetical protein